MFTFISSFAQNAAPPYQRNFTPNSPEASAFNKYGDIGVSQFTGSPNISYPLSLSEDVPISISYNASGNKPEEHHGWVGAGFNLNVGGMISRIKRGSVDEFKEYGDINNIYKGYIDNYAKLQSTTSNWDGDALLTEMVNTTNVNYFSYSKDAYEPDEFVFNFNNYSGSFLLNHTGEWVFRGNNPSEFKIKEVNIQQDLSIKQTNTLPVTFARAIMGFTIIANDGTEYTFGGDDLSVDFTYSLGSLSDQINMYKSMSPMGWHLTKIKPVNGKEINFTYDKDQFSVLLNSSRSLGSLNAKRTTTNISQQSSWPGIDKSFTLMRNAYLSEIQTPYETIKFEKSKLTTADADDYPIESSITPPNSTSSIHIASGVDLTQRKWFELNAIKTYTKGTTPSVLRHYALEYIKSASNRLQLKRIRQVNVDNYNYAVTHWHTVCKFVKCAR